MDGKEVQPVEHSNQRILTTQQIAVFYETTERRISENFNANKARYVEGKHYFCLEGEQLKAFKTTTEFPYSLKGVNKLYLWTEKGALMHAKSLNTDKAWEVYDELVETYYRKVIEPQQPPILFSHKHMRRMIISAEKTVLPPDTWCIFFEMERFLNREEIRGVLLQDSATPDVSAGLHWCRYLRENSYDMELIIKYQHHYPDRRGTQWANAYPNAWLGTFASWFEGTYLKEFWMNYLKGRLVSDSPLQLRSSGKDNNWTA